MTPAAQVQDTSRMSLDDYLAICAGPTAGPSDEQATLAGFASVMGEFTERLEAVEPPEEVSDWHDAVLVYQRAVKKALDDAPGPGDDESEDEYILGVLLPVALQHQPEITEAIKSMDRDLVARMLEAGCIDDEFVEESAPQIDLAVLTVGKSVEAMVDNPDLPNRYSFQAEQGGRYLIEVTRKTLTDFVVTLPVTESQFPQNFFLSEGDEQLSLRWKASTSDTYFFQVAGDGIGTYTVSVRLDLSPISPSNVKYAWDGTSIQVSWDSADGADYYNVYYDDFFETACSVGRDGRPSFCGELATNVTGTTFVHTDPDLRANYYWVVACNQHGCSSVTDRDNPAMPLGDGSGGPTTGGPCQAGVSLDEGDFCTVVNPDVQVGSDRFEVRKGSGCYNDICAGESTILDGFIAYANADGSWLVTRVPDGTSGGEGSTPVPTPTQSAVPTPTSTAIPAATATPIPVPTPVPTATATPAPEDTTPSAPANVRYALEGSAIRVTWNAVDNADYYNVYYDEFSDSSCSLGRDGSPRFCGELATNVTEMEYLHADPAHGANYYWVVACNSGGCSDVDSENSATPIVARAGRPTNVRYAVEGSTIRVSWDLVSGADFYNVYYDDFFDSSCSLGTDGSPRFCEELAANVSEATYVHTSPDSGDNYYWVVACNRGGCSEVDSENPARSIGTGTVPAPAGRAQCRQGRAGHALQRHGRRKLANRPTLAE